MWAGKQLVTTVNTHGCTESCVTKGCFICICTCDSTYVYTFMCVSVCVRVSLCVRLIEKELELESGVSPRDVGFWCFPNQRSGTSSDEDVMSSSGFLSHSNSGPTSHATLLSLSFCLRLYFRLSLCLSLYSICLSVHLSVCFSLSVFISCFPSPCSVGE